MIKKLLRCIREYKRDSILTPILVTLEVVMEVIIPLLMANLIDYGITAGNMRYILKMGTVLAIFAMLSLYFGAIFLPCSKNLLRRFSCLLWQPFLQVLSECCLATR